jgi:hypothetical protein
MIWTTELTSYIQSIWGRQWIDVKEANSQLIRQEKFIRDLKRIIP